MDIVDVCSCNRQGNVSHSSQSCGFSNIDLLRQANLLATKCIAGCPSMLDEHVYLRLSNATETGFPWSGDWSSNVPAFHASVDSEDPFLHFIFPAFHESWHDTKDMSLDFLTVWWFDSQVVQKDAPSDYEPRNGVWIEISAEHWGMTMRQIKQLMNECKEIGEVWEFSGLVSLALFKTCLTWWWQLPLVVQRRILIGGKLIQCATWWKITFCHVQLAQAWVTWRKPLRLTDGTSWVLSQCRCFTLRLCSEEKSRVTFESGRSCVALLEWECRGQSLRSVFVVFVLLPVFAVAPCSKDRKRLAICWSKLVCSGIRGNSGAYSWCRWSSFCLCICNLPERGAERKVTMLCVLIWSLQDGAGPTVSQQIGASMNNSPFGSVLKNIKVHTCIPVDSQGFTYRFCVARSKLTRQAGGGGHVALYTCYQVGRAGILQSHWEEGLHRTSLFWSFV